MERFYPTGWPDVDRGLLRIKTLGPGFRPGLDVYDRRGLTPLTRAHLAGYHLKRQEF